jgi:subtilase family serine protease
VTVLAATGDQGSAGLYCDPSSGCANPDNVICCSSTREAWWPASDPLVTAVGGTRLHLNDQGYRTAPDSVYQDLSDGLGRLSTPGPVFTPNAGGGGLSTVFSRPQFQDEVSSVVGDSRGTPDIAMSAAFNGGVDVYWSVLSSEAGWGISSGTSEATPLFAGIVALADQVAGHSLGYLNPALYAMAGSGVPEGIVPIYQGTNAFTFCVPADIQSNGSCASNSDLVHVPGFRADGSYNDATGWGTVDAAVFVPALARFAG